MGTEGFSGRYRMDIHDLVMVGEVWSYRPARCGVREVTRPGGHTVLPRRQADGFRIPEAAWLLEYGRGFVPAAFPLIPADVLFSALGGTTLAETIWTYGKMAWRELAMNGKI